MNKLIEARTYVSGVWNEVNEHGVGRGGWLKNQIATARRTVLIALDGLPEMQADWLTLELFAASNCVANRDAEGALKSLKTVGDALEDLILQEPVPWD